MIYSVAYTVVFFICRLIFRLKMTGIENVPEGATLICANHTSLWDPILLALFITKKYRPRFMAKAELFKNPLLGAVIKFFGAFPVERGSGDVKAIKKSLEVLNSGGKLIVFPEGGRIKGDEQAAAKTGAGMLALRTGAEVLPVYITPGKKRIFGRIDVIAGKPLTFIHDRSLGNVQYQTVASEIMDTIRTQNPEEGVI